MSFRYTERLAEARIEPSVGNVGNGYYNALAETIIGLYKAEVIHRLGPWKTAGGVEWETLRWVDWYNNRRLLQPIRISCQQKPSRICINSKTSPMKSRKTD